MPSPPQASKTHIDNALTKFAALAIGFFVGLWVIGPGLSKPSSAIDEERDTSKVLSYEEMLAQPDPFPYRAATPVYASVGAPAYAAAAKQRAQSEARGHIAAREDRSNPWGELRERPSNSQSDSWRRRAAPAISYDRHAVH